MCPSSALAPCTHSSFYVRAPARCPALEADRGRKAPSDPSGIAQGGDRAGRNRSRGNRAGPNPHRAETERRRIRAVRALVRFGRA